MGAPTSLVALGRRPARAATVPRFGSCFRSTGRWPCLTTWGCPPTNPVRSNVRSPVDALFDARSMPCSMRGRCPVALDRASSEYLLVFPAPCTVPSVAAMVGFRRFDGRDRTGYSPTPPTPRDRSASEGGQVKALGSGWRALIAMRARSDDARSEPL